MTIIIQTDHGPDEVDAVVRPSGLAVHTQEPEVHTLHRDTFGPMGYERRVTTIMAKAAITHVASGRRLLEAATIERGLATCERLEASGVDWSAPAEVLAQSDEGMEAVRNCHFWALEGDS